MQDIEKASYSELRGSVKLEYDQFQKMPIDGLGHHLVDGVHIITPAPSTYHQIISSNISFLLTNYVKKRKIGYVLTSPLDVKFSNVDGYQPDLVYIRNESSSIISKNHIDGSPNLIIEILSHDSGSADFGWKKDLAEKYAVDEYWVIDPFDKIVYVFYVSDNKLIELGKFGMGETIKFSLDDFKDLKLKVAEIFEDEE